MTDQKAETPTTGPSNIEKMHGLPWALSGQTTNAIYLNLALAGPVFMETLGLFRRAHGGRGHGRGLRAAACGVGLARL